MIKTGENISSNPDRTRKQMEEDMRKAIEDNQKEMENMKLSYEQKLADAIKKSKELKSGSLVEQSKHCAHLTNINSDPNLTGSLKHLIQFESSKNKKQKTQIIIGAADNADIQMLGLGLLDKHAIITNNNDKTLSIEPCEGARVLRNGKQYESKFQLQNFDRLVFGASLYYLFIDPLNFNDKSSTTSPQTVEQRIESAIQKTTTDNIQKEIAKESGLIDLIADQSEEEIECMNDLLDLMPHIEEANQMSIILDKKIKYEPIILRPYVLGESQKKPKPYVKVNKFGCDKEWIWSENDFIDRKSFMSEQYLDFKDGIVASKKDATINPFFNSDSDPVLIGTAVIMIKSLIHMVPVVEENAKVFDYSKKLIGSVKIEMLPCDAQGIVHQDISKVIIKEPKKNLKSLYFIVRIDNIKCMSIKYKNFFCQFRMYNENKYTKTPINDNKNNQFQKMFQYKTVNDEV
jgi:kinesin family member 1